MRHLILIASLAVTPALAQAPPGLDQLPGQHFEILAQDLPLPLGQLPYVANAPERIERGDRLPIVPEGFTVSLFVENLPNPRRIEVLPDGSVLVVQQQTGQVILLRDTNDDGKADQGGVFASGFNNPFGIVLVPAGPDAGDLLLSDVMGVYRIPISSGGEIAQLTLADAFGRPAGHITRALAVDPVDGGLYVAVGSMQNLAEEPEVKATVQHFSADGSSQRTFATGLRNATGLRLQPSTGDLYAVVMERDAMGDDLVPDFLTRVADGDDFGWPYQYAGGFAQPEFRQVEGAAVKRVAADLPDVLFEAHSAPMDLIFLPETWPETGYKLVRVPFGDDHRPTGGYDNFATGFWVTGESPAKVWGRPAALGLMPDGALLVADDFAGTVWKITPPKE
jgi:glucose/arabinose dehydrogenase